ncbi:Modification methylase [Collimonas arenae]|uniref:DNA (cytosine-5-)-methyltransferase n=1 Tax=Collimonas arenae TaxID=279058 RepID=A0A0A1F5W4_9BURK|nr:DNA cytosine methyltransferase [Collimonas arenae]AIY39180.1 Modification methylase [Collimonas arenae]
MPINIVDLFAGPGGLGEGFSSLSKGNAFRILISAEMESSAHKTLRLRSFFRLIRHDARSLSGYYEFCNGDAKLPYNTRSQSAWEESGLEARQLTLGNPNDNRVLDAVLDQKLQEQEPWVLIGGPPCQAYSLVGRSRNIGTPSYRPEDDHRHFLYKEYLRIIRDRRPPVFVMENVKGILSSRVAGKTIFHDILRDLADPDGVFGVSSLRPGYRIHSLVTNTFFESGMDPNAIDPRDFIVKSEDFGIPQARHRVILLGVRTDIDANFKRLVAQPTVHVREVIRDLPPLRSKLSNGDDSARNWSITVKNHLVELAEEALDKNMDRLSAHLKRYSKQVRVGLSPGALHCPKSALSREVPYYTDWYLDSKLRFWLNHESRSHMTSDLRRYGYAAAYAALNDRSPKGHEEFSLAGLAPNHENWESGKFADRFRVQRYDAPASTITSHIAKDGHYFIHPDPAQCRSLTVREAARLQTFPDNYFFQGNRTQQYHQVGNAVPPLLAKMIAQIVKEILT